MSDRLAGLSEMLSSLSQEVQRLRSYEQAGLVPQLEGGDIDAALGRLLELLPEGWEQGDFGLHLSGNRGGWIADAIWHNQEAYRTIHLLSTPSENAPGYSSSLEAVQALLRAGDLALQALRSPRPGSEPHSYLVVRPSTVRGAKA